jgi:hypothetical protein
MRECREGAQWMMACVSAVKAHAAQVDDGVRGCREGRGQHMEAHHA